MNTNKHELILNRTQTSSLRDAVVWHSQNTEVSIVCCPFSFI